MQRATWPWIAFVLYVGALAAVTMLGGRRERMPGPPLGNWTPGETIGDLLRGEPPEASKYLIGNLLLLTPLVILIALIWGRLSMLSVLALVLVTSVAIELTQMLVVGRSGDIDDVILNTLGAGAVCAAVALGRARVRNRAVDTREQSDQAMAP